MGERRTSGLLRQSFPKGADLGTHGAEELEAVASALNARPRMTPGWRTRAETFDKFMSSAQTEPAATMG